MRLKRRLLGQYGDSLIEVTLALGILSMVLLTAMAVAVRAYNAGQVAQERTSVANEAQAQMEVLRAFRDNHTWEEFLRGRSGQFAGVLNAATASPCVPTSQVPGDCFHMQAIVLGSRTEFVPVGGKANGYVPTSYIEMMVIPGAGSTPKVVDIQISYGFDVRGGGSSSIGHIKTRLTDPRTAGVVPPSVSVLPTPTPIATPTPVPTPTPPVCSVGKSDIVLVMDASSSMTESWVRADGTRTTKAAMAVVTARNFAENFQLGIDTNHMGVIQFNSGVTELSPVIWDTAALLTAIGRYRNTTGTHITDALIRADTMLPTALRPSAQPVVILLSDGLPDDGDNPSRVLAQATLMKNSGIRIYTVYIGSASSSTAIPLMRAVAGNGGTFANALLPDDMTAIIQNIVERETCE